MKFNIILFILFGVISSCNKIPIGDYFQCKIDGESYTPDNCTTCLVAEMYGDSVFAFYANSGVSVIGIGVNGSPFNTKTFQLDQHRGGNGLYKSSYSIISNFRTGSIHKGILQITGIDNVHKEIEGNFSFQGFNSYQNKIAIITDGKFRMTYKNY